MVRKWYVVSRHLQGCSPHLCRLRTDGLAPASKYWTYRSRVGDMGTESLVYAPASLVGSREKLGTDPQISRPACCGLCWEYFFSGVVGSVQIYRHLAKGFYMWTTWSTYGIGPYADWAWEACGVLVRFSPTRCTSIRIAVTLGYE
jgi:hypothetical protein